MIFSNKILTDEIASLREENRRLRDSHFELIDKFVHNRVPERLKIPYGTTQNLSQADARETGQGDPVSIAERQAYMDSMKREGYLNGQGEPIPLDAVLDEG